MKKLPLIIMASVLCAGMVFAQEADASAEEQPGQQAFPQAAGGGVKLASGLGTLDIHGIFLVGARARMEDMEGWPSDDKWNFEGLNAMWEENRADLYMDYSFSNYGAFLGLRAQSYVANNFAQYESTKPVVFPRYAFVYANFGAVKLSVGKLYDEILTVQGSKVWKTEGIGDPFRFTDEDSYSIRLEIKPVDGLNVGMQYFFPNDAYRVDANTPGGGGPLVYEEYDAWKEIGLGASYTSDLFNIQAGVRFDSSVDRFSRLDTGPQGLGTYHQLYYGAAQSLTDGVPAIAAAISPYPLVDRLFTPPYKHMDKIIRTDWSKPDEPKAEYLPYDGGTYAFFGFNLKGIKNLVANAHGALFNLGAFNEFGYGRFAEYIKYNNIVPRLGVGLIGWQEFYGDDVFNDTKADPRDTNPQDGQDVVPFYNSPFLKFGVQVSYDIITTPQMPIPILQGVFEVNYGICENVLDTYIQVKPSLTLSLGTLFFDLFYELEYTGYSEKSYVEPVARHTVGLAMMMLF
jgi:hypothetical protein